MIRERLKTMMVFYCGPVVSKEVGELIDEAFDEPLTTLKGLMLTAQDEGVANRDIVLGTLVGFAMVNASTDDRFWEFFKGRVTKEVQDGRGK